MSDAQRRCLAFLRGMNVGGHRVSMEELRRHFASMGFANAETFIASGNVIFHAPRSTAAASLEQRIETRLLGALGYAVATFIRTPEELAAVVDAVPFPREDLEPATHTTHVGFLRAAPPADVAHRLGQLATPVDRVTVVGREVYWLCRGKSTDSLLKWPQLLRTHQLETTMRNLNTLQRMVARFGE